MASRPLALGLTICQDVVINPDTGNATVVEVFGGISVEEFPGTPSPFRVFAALTECDGVTEFVITVDASDPSSPEVYRGRFRAVDPLTVVNLSYQLTRCVFPGPDLYTFTLWSGGEMIAQRSLRVYLRGEGP